jgi:hypothetical protein
MTDGQLRGVVLKNMGFNDPAEEVEILLGLAGFEDGREVVGTKNRIVGQARVPDCFSVGPRN